MADRPSADRSAELLLWFHREPSRYLAEGRRRNTPHPDSDVVLKLAQGRPVGFADAALNDPRMSLSLKTAAAAYIRNVYFHADANPYQTLGLAPGASQEEIRENFRQLMHLVHPDRQGDHKQWPDACAAQANRAYAMLRDPDARGRLEREAEARAALARAISRAAAAAEASQMPVATWPKPKRGAPFAKPMLPEWVTARVGGYARKNPGFVAFLVLLLGAGLFVIVSAWSGEDGMLVRGARETYASAGSLINKPEPVGAALVKGVAPAPDTAKGRVVTTASPPEATASTTGGRAAESREMLVPPAIEQAVPSVVPDTIATSRPIVLPTPVAQAPAAGPVAEPAVAQSIPPAVAVSEQPITAPTLPPMSPSAPTLTAEVAIAPLPAPAAAQSPPASAEIEALFASFVETYERGRLDAFAALFDDDADTNLHRGRSAIRAEYDELFRLSQWRRMQLTRVNWRRNGDRAIAKGEITVRIGWRDGREVEQRLNLDMELMRRDGRVVIARMTHQPKSP